VVAGVVSAAAAVWTIGHSTRTLEAFLAVLAAHELQAIADVRRFPGSKRYPHFAREALEQSLADAGIEYLWLPELGGRRRPRPDSPNTAWRNEAFRGYADHIDTAEFGQGYSQLVALATRLRTAMMCSELLWWRCHRSLISDALRVSGIEVIHILGIDKTTPHPYTSPARVVDGELTYGEPLPA
jgi:uncharacterized protein (DUF488 family)